MLEIIKTGSSMIPVLMVQPLIRVVARFLQAADVSSTLISFCGMLMSLFSKRVITMNQWGGFLPLLRSVLLALPCVVQSKQSRRITGLMRSRLFEGKLPTLWHESQTFRTFLYRKLSDIVHRAEEFCRGTVVSRFPQQGRDKDTIKTMGKDFTAAVNNFHVRPFPSWGTLSLKQEPW